MLRPAVSELIKDNQSYYLLVVGIAKRARKIAEELEEKDEMLEEKPVMMAVEEYAAGKFKILPRTKEINH